MKFKNEFFFKIIEKVNISVDGFPVAAAVFGQAKNGLSPLWSRNETTTFHDGAFGKRLQRGVSPRYDSNI